MPPSRSRGTQGSAIARRRDRLRLLPARPSSATVKEFGKLDVLVNNAAFQQQQERFEDITIEQFDRTFKTNIYGYFFMVKAALPHLKAGSSIINVGSIAGMRGTGRLMDYAATKGAIHAFTKALAQNFIERKIRVNCVAPGPVWTPFIPMSEPPEQVAKHGKKVPMEPPGSARRRWLRLSSSSPRRPTPAISPARC